jgi:hypothetical protein
VFSNKKHLSLEQLRKENAHSHVLAFYDPTKQTLVHGLIIGPADLAFEAHHEEITVAQHPFRKFRVVVPASYFSLPPHFSSEFLHTRTVRPEYPDDPTLEANLRALMEGRSDAACLDQFEFGSLFLVKRFLMDRLPEVGKETAVRISQHIAWIERAMLRLEGLGIILLSGETVSHIRTPDGSTPLNNAQI